MEQKPAHEVMREGGGCPTLNKNATGLGAPVAVNVNRKDRFNCCAETRPWNYREQVPILIST